jgi:hypothetical protein
MATGRAFIMSRMYIVNHWNDAAAYSGEQIGDRLKDSTALHFNRDGSANVELYSEEYALKKKKTSVPLVDRVLPQQRRVRVLTEQLYELEAERKNGLDIHTYSQLRDVLICKRDRAEVLLKKALSAKPIRPESEEDEGVSYTETFSTSSDNNSHRDSYSSPVGVGFFAEVVDGLSDQNSLKNILKKACKVIRTVRYCNHKARAYWQELTGKNLLART